MRARRVGDPDHGDVGRRRGGVRQRPRLPVDQAEQQLDLRVHPPGRRPEVMRLSSEPLQVTDQRVAVAVARMHDPDAQCAEIDERWLHGVHRRRSPRR